MGKKICASPDRWTRQSPFKGVCVAGPGCALTRSPVTVAERSGPLGVRASPAGEAKSAPRPPLPAARPPSWRSGGASSVPQPRSGSAGLGGRPVPRPRPSIPLSLHPSIPPPLTAHSPGARRGRPAARTAQCPHPWALRPGPPAGARRRFVPGQSSGPARQERLPGARPAPSRCGQSPAAAAAAARSAAGPRGCRLQELCKHTQNVF